MLPQRAAEPAVKKQERHVVNVVRICAPRAVAAPEPVRDLDAGAVARYVSAVGLQMIAISATFAAADAAADNFLGGSLPYQAVTAMFFLMSLKSRTFSPLDNSRPNLSKAVDGKPTAYLLIASTHDLGLHESTRNAPRSRDKMSGTRIPQRIRRSHHALVDTAWRLLPHHVDLGRCTTASVVIHAGLGGDGRAPP